jgi:hypothetical protein
MRSPTQTKAESYFTPVQTGLLQRKCVTYGQHTLTGGECTECQKKRMPLQRRATNQDELSEVPPIVGEVLRSPGQPLDSKTRTFMESRFSQDFSQVRVHTDTQAAASAQAVNALAYTVGNNVVFGAGQYPSGTHAGRLLMAHELTHVVQQSAHSPALATKPIAIAQSADSAEREADAVANQVVSGSGVSYSINQHPVAIQKKEPNEAKDQEQITLSSGLKINKELFATMLAMCAKGKLDPVRCVEMRQELQRLPEEMGTRISPRFNLGLEFGKKEEYKFLSPSEVKKLLSNPFLGLGQPIISPPGWKPPAATPEPHPASKSFFESLGEGVDVKIAGQSVNLSIHGLTKKLIRKGDLAANARVGFTGTLSVITSFRNWHYSAEISPTSGEWEMNLSYPIDSSPPDLTRLRAIVTRGREAAQGIVESITDPDTYRALEKLDKDALKKKFEPYIDPIKYAIDAAQGLKEAKPGVSFGVTAGSGLGPGGPPSKATSPTDEVHVRAVLTIIF